MRNKRLLAGFAAALLLGGALAEPVATEYLVNLSPAEIRQLEQRLFQLGYLSGAYDEVYDANTRLALESFQQANGLTVTGAADEETQARLASNDALSRQDYLTRFANAYAQMTPMGRGSVSNDVMIMQRRLKEYGYFSGDCDGVFSEATQLAVESFQMVNGLTVTGVADGAMLMRLMADSPIAWPSYLSEMSAALGDSGLSVYALQKKLAQMGCFTGECTGSFGELTQKAVLRFQEDNGLEATGVADAATWAVLYSNTAAAATDALRFGDYGENIRALQMRLNGLGFFDHEITGEYGYTTESAVRLFQMAGGTPVTGEIDGDTYTRLMSDSAPSMQDRGVQQAFQLTLDLADEDAREAVAAAARRMLNQRFPDDDDDLYPGFAFVQYVCVDAGLPVTFPEDLIRLADQPVDAVDEVEAGDIVAFQNASGDNVTIRLAIGAGDGQIVNTTESGGWVILSFMDQMGSANIYRWSARPRFGE